ncbi:MAG TPA: HAD-IA family hydrolase [Patescibacteria group bacterium]|nr:HAD-IA family hydrolase [Patescibacteria group bacterium]
MYKAIIFDFFGVIQADPYQRWLSKRGLKREGSFADIADAMDRGFITREDFFERLSELSDDTVENIRKTLYDEKFIDEELVKLISLLKQKYQIGLLSNSRGDYLRPILDKHGITQLFDEIIISSEVGIIKPDPAIFELALGRTGITAEQAIFIDDNETNAQAAASIGIKSIWYKDLTSLKEKLADLGIRAS